MPVLPPIHSVGTLRERFTADMTVRGFSSKTQHDYLRTVARVCVLPRSVAPARPRLRTSAAFRSSSPSAA